MWGVGCGEREWEGGVTYFVEFVILLGFLCRNVGDEEKGRLGVVEDGQLRQGLFLSIRLCVVQVVPLFLSQRRLVTTRICNRHHFVIQSSVDRVGPPNAEPPNRQTRTRTRDRRHDSGHDDAPDEQLGWACDRLFTCNDILPSQARKSSLRSALPLASLARSLRCAALTHHRLDGASHPYTSHHHHLHHSWIAKPRLRG